MTVAPAMIAVAQGKTDDPRIRFLVADVATLDAGHGYDLVALLNMPPFFAEIGRVLRPEGSVIVAASWGAATPFYTPPAVLERGLRRHGITSVADGETGGGSWFVGRKRSDYI